MSQGGAAAAAGNGVSPGNVPVCYYGGAGRVPAAVERRVRAAELFLRCAACGLAVLAAALLGADRQTRVIFTVQKEARFTDMQSLVFLVIANGMAACYSLLQGARCMVSILTGGVLISRPMAWAIFSCDQVMAYFTISAVAVAMEAAMIGKYGNMQFQWMKTCHLYKRFCAQAGGAVACAIAVSLNMVCISSPRSTSSGCTAAARGGSDWPGFSSLSLGTQAGLPPPPLAFFLGFNTQYGLSNHSANGRAHFNSRVFN